MKRLVIWEWAIYAALLLVIIWALAPQNLPVIIYKLALASIAGVVGHRLDRSLFPYGRPDQLVELGADGRWETGEAIVLASAMMRRAVIVAAVIVAVAMGL